MINRSVLGSFPCHFSTFLAAKKQTVVEKRSQDLKLKTPKVKSHRIKIALYKVLAVYLITCLHEPLHILDDLAFLTTLSLSCLAIMMVSWETMGLGSHQCLPYKKIQTWV